MRRFDCPLPQYEDAYIVLPDIWLGIHAQRRDQAVDAAKEYKSQTLTQFGVAIALLDDWLIPGMSGNPEKWDFTKLDLQIISWVIDVTLNDFAKAFIVPKVFSSPSPSP